MADRRTSIRRVTAALVAVTTLSACGGGTPSKADFVAKIRESIDLEDAISGLGIPPTKGDALIDDFVECQYDALATDPDLLRQAYERPGDPTLTPAIDGRTMDCVTELNTGMTESADPRRAATTTTTTLVVPSVPTSAPSVTLAPDGATIDTLPTIPGSDETTLAPEDSGVPTSQNG